jgi:hypothetical protein
MGNAEKVVVRLFTQNYERLGALCFLSIYRSLCLIIFLKNIKSSLLQMLEVSDWINQILCASGCIIAMINSRLIYSLFMIYLWVSLSPNNPFFSHSSLRSLAFLYIAWQDEHLRLGIEWSSHSKAKNVLCLLLEEQLFPLQSPFIVELKK